MAVLPLCVHELGVTHRLPNIDQLYASYHVLGTSLLLGSSRRTHLSGSKTIARLRSCLADVALLLRYALGGRIESESMAGCC